MLSWSKLVAMLPGVLAVGCLLASGMLVAGEDFRIDNEVYSGGRKVADSRTTTIFAEGLVCDYLDEPAEVIVLDQQGGRFVLLDPTRQLRAELTTAEVLAFCQQLQQRAAAQDDPTLKFLAAPQFEQRYDAARNELTFASAWMTYRLVLAAAPSPAVVEQVRDFSDWYARLNTLLNPGAKPPAARLAVNAAVASRDAVPREVHLTLSPSGGSTAASTTVRSVHRLVRPLAQADRARVAETRQSMTAFKSVEFEQYRRREAP